MLCPLVRGKCFSNKKGLNIYPVKGGKLLANGGGESIPNRGGESIPIGGEVFSLWWG